MFIPGSLRRRYDPEKKRIFSGEKRPLREITLTVNSDIETDTLHLICSRSNRHTPENTGGDGLSTFYKIRHCTPVALNKGGGANGRMRTLDCCTLVSMRVRDTRDFERVVLIDGVRVVVEKFELELFLFYKKNNESSVKLSIEK